MDTPLRLLLVEDNPDHAFLARREFKKCGAPVEIKHVEDTTQALEYLQSAPLLPDGILLDIKLPGRDGFELLSLLKADPRTQNVPVVLLSTSPAPADIERGAQLGAVSYFTKPVDAPEVLKVFLNEMQKAAPSA